MLGPGGAPAPARGTLAAPAEDLRELVPLQRALLGAAVDLVRPGGVVLYATCSPVLAETSDVLSAVLVARDDVRLEPLPLDLPDAGGDAGRDGAAVAAPARHRRDVPGAAATHVTGVTRLVPIR